jgi:hypothetical protein
MLPFAPGFLRGDLRLFQQPIYNYTFFTGWSISRFYFRSVCIG